MNTDISYTVELCTGLLLKTMFTWLPRMNHLIT